MFAKRRLYLGPSVTSYVEVSRRPMGGLMQPCPTRANPEPRKAEIDRNVVRISFVHNLMSPLLYRSRGQAQRDCLHNYKVV